jgi:hypothetical protein
MGIDIILGMDWLRKYDGVILCAKRAIRLTKEDGTIVVTPDFYKNKFFCPHRSAYKMHINL